MAKGYAIFTEAIRDQPGYQRYVGKAVATIRNAGGRIIVVDDNVTVLEGQWHGTRTVVIEFDSKTAARDWYDSSEYRAIMGERHASAEANAALLQGLEP